MLRQSLRVFAFVAVGLLSGMLDVVHGETVALTVTINAGNETIQATNSVNFDTKLFPAGTKNSSKQSGMQGGIIYSARCSTASDDSAALNIGPTRTGQALSFSGMASITKKIPAPSEPPVSPVTVDAPGATSPYGNATSGGPTSPSKKWDASAGIAPKETQTGTGPSAGGGNFSPAISVITPLPSSSWGAAALLSAIVLAVRFKRIARRVMAF